MMNLNARIKQFIDNPFPLWNVKLTQELVQNKWSDLHEEGLINADEYCTSRIWLKNPKIELDKRIRITEDNDSSIYLELPTSKLHLFYNEHGLEPLTEKEIGLGVLNKLQSALQILHLVNPLYDCIASLVRVMEILRNEDANIDLSYSHPLIPFSIFLSVCKDDSIIANLRVAESILHEAMHLKLTLIEEVVPLIKPGTNGLYYSPWKGEERPIKGVLHGLFVFKSIEKFCVELQKTKIFLNVDDYITRRINEIKNETEQLDNFESCSGFTEEGANLVASLLPLN